MRLGIVSLIAAMLLVTFAACSYAFYIDFEQGLGKNGQNIGGDYTGIFFTNSGGLDWLYGDSNVGTYNTHSVDLGLSWNDDNYNHYGYCWAWLGDAGSWGRIDFTNQDGTYLQIRYCSGTELWLEAYDAGNNMIAVASGPANRRHSEGVLDMGTLLVTAPPQTQIAYVKIHDSGNYFLVDNLQGDFTGVTATQNKTWGSIKGMFR